MRGGEVGGTIATCGAPSGDHRVMVSGETDGAASCHPVTTQPGCVAWSAVSRQQGHSASLSSFRRFIFTPTVHIH